MNKACKFAYRQEMSGLRYTQAQKREIARRAAEAAAMQPRREGGRKLRPMLAAGLAAVLVLSLTVGAAAAGVFRQISEIFAPVIENAESQPELMESMGTPIGVSDTQGGITITAEAIFGDSHNAIVLYTVSREDGTPLLPEGTEINRLLFGGTGGSIGELGMRYYGEPHFLPYTPGELTATYVEQYLITGEKTEGEKQSDFTDLIYEKPDGSWEKISQGKYYAQVDEYLTDWELSFRFAYADAGRELSVNGETFSANGKDFLVDAVSVSPMGVFAHYEVTGETVKEEWLEQYGGWAQEDYVRDIPLVLRLKDGTEISLAEEGRQEGDVSAFSETENGPRVLDGNTINVYKCGAFDRIILLEEMDCVLLNGIEYPVNP